MPSPLCRYRFHFQNIRLLDFKCIVLRWTFIFLTYPKSQWAEIVAVRDFSGMRFDTIQIFRYKIFEPKILSESNQIPVRTCKASDRESATQKAKSWFAHIKYRSSCINIANSKYIHTYVNTYDSTRQITINKCIFSPTYA